MNRFLNIRLNLFGIRKFYFFFKSKDNKIKKIYRKYAIFNKQFFL